MRYIDCHVHASGRVLESPSLLRTHFGGRMDIKLVRRTQEDPEFLVQVLDEANVEKAFIISVVMPELGFDFRTNKFAASFCAKYPERLMHFGSLHPRKSKNPKKELNYLLDELGVKGIKIHPPQQHFYPNEYRSNGLKSLETIYSMAEERKVPLMIHTGTSVFPHGRNVYGDPIYVDDVAVDFPDLKIILAHGGRPLWTETASFLVRRHRNVYMDISSIPPKHLLEYFPRLETIAGKTMFGSDWPDPSVPGIKENLAFVSSLRLSDSAKRQILRETAMNVIRS